MILYRFQSWGLHKLLLCSIWLLLRCVNMTVVGMALLVQITWMLNASSDSMLLETYAF